VDEDKRFEEGMKVRRAVLGDAHVDRTLSNKDSFNDEFEQLITRYAWGEVWTRPVLPRQTRSLITLAALVALKHDDYIRLHLRGAINNGVSRDEIKELLMHLSIYCGVPTANNAFRIAREVFAEIDAGP